MAVREPPGPGAMRVDALIAIALALLGCVMVALSSVADLLSDSDVPPAFAMLAAVALAAPLVFRRTHPVPSAAVQSVVYVGFGEFAAVELYASQIAIFLGLYSIGAWETNRPRAKLARGLIVLVMLAWVVYGVIQALVDPETGERGVSAYFAFLAINLLASVMFFGGAWLFGDRAWARALSAAELARAHDEIRAQQEQLTGQAVALERVRIARELHDVVAHHVSAMGVQAGAARRLLDRDSEGAKEALQHVERSAREAITELRSLVLTLRSEDDRTGVAPDLTGVPALVAATERAGQRVRLTRIGTQSPLSPAVELTAYRVIQEALTNARKHAGAAATVDVRLRFSPSALEVEVADDGYGNPAATRGTGMGLIGLRERVLAIGGTVEAGPKQRGGFLVRATLPVVPTVSGEQSATDVAAETQAEHALGLVGASDPRILPERAGA